jgi:hypothetical protein
MESKTSYFLKLAYSFFPRGISDEDDNDVLTPEHQNLTNSLKERSYLDEKWNALLNSLQSKYVCEDIGAPDRIIRGFRIAIVNHKPNRHYIVINVSKLIPYYCFYTTPGLGNKKPSQPGFFCFSDFETPDQEIVKTVSKQIPEFFEGYKEFPSDIIQTELKDVLFEDKGELINAAHKSASHWPMTVFNAFFSSNTFY